jgi:hypothetical protein
VIPGVMYSSQPKPALPAQDPVAAHYRALGKHTGFLYPGEAEPTCCTCEKPWPCPEAEVD